ncbi:type II secretion system F family protein, partial [Adlercreutzia sp.]
MAKPKLDSAGISLFCESVAMMLAAGIQTDEAVGMLSEDIGDVALQATCESVYGRLCAGDTLAVAMKASGAFPRYAVDMVGVGEASGRL